MKKKWLISNQSEDNTKGWHILKKNENLEVLEAILKEDTHGNFLKQLY